MAISQFAVEYNDLNYMERAFAPVEAENKRIVMEDTWGHLAPERNQTYTGYMLFTLGAWGDYTPICADFKGLPDSPWFFDDMMSFIEKSAKTHGAIYRFDGKYRNHRFIGKIRRVTARRKP